VFDGMLDPGLMAELPTRDYLAERLKGSLQQARYYEEMLDRLRIFAAEQRFLIGIRLLTGAINGAGGRPCLHPSGRSDHRGGAEGGAAEIEAAHGKFPGGRVAVAGMGKLGSFELTAGSDIDLILLYDYDDDGGESDGDKPLDAVRYFTRITQRLIAALSAPTAEGVLYEVDMRLRPSGNKGPVATRINRSPNISARKPGPGSTWRSAAPALICGDGSLIAEASALFREVLGQIATCQGGARCRRDARADRQGKAAERMSGI
jgi:glutamate-ammonia-ligase adenylyltransferase